MNPPTASLNQQNHRDTEECILSVLNSARSDMFIAHVNQTEPQAPLGATRESLFYIYPIKHINRKDRKNIYLCVCICHNVLPVHVSLLTELEIRLFVPVSINISPLTGLQSFKLIRDRFVSASLPPFSIPTGKTDGEGTDS
jgi:hypothetical protein